MQGLPVDDQEKAASILFGIPRCFISGIVLGDDCITEEILEFITRKFPGAFITRNTGEIIYKHGDTKEMMDLRLEKVKLSIKNGMALKKIDMLSRELDRTKAEKNQMWDAIAELPIEEIARIYDALNYQGNTLEMAENFKNGHRK